MFALVGQRENLNKERTIELLAPLKNEPTKWEKIKLSGKSFDLESAIYTSELLPSLTNLKSVDISDIIAGKPKDEANKILKVICDSLQDNNNIVDVDISDNALGEKGIESCESLLSKTETIETLILNNDGLSPAAAKRLKEIMLKGEKKINLKKLHFFNNLLKDGGAEEISEIIAQSPFLSDFRFSSTRSGLDGILKLVASLSSSDLISLDLSDNTAGSEEGSIKLASLLKEQKNLTKLNIAAMGLTDEGFQRVAESVSHLSFTDLDFSSNELSSKGINNLFLSLKNSLSSLVKLNLDENDFGEHPNKFVSFCDFLKENELKSLQFLSLKVNQLKKASVISLIQSLTDISTLTHLDLNENLLSHSDLEDVDQVLGNNKNILQSMDDCISDDEDDEDDNDKSDD
eukprot:TRINITY_DN3150_c0_g1_i1.p1 TRINITY_DN3150_c0_g1~~TRINITY_DN3150_c0_g1_i1.p1  ORF type:complete len:403 (-),score=167.68 TRINITY_DN3150_c0_g1_i1:96-1304(-)